MDKLIRDTLIFSDAFDTVSDVVEATPSKWDITGSGVTIQTNAYYSSPKCCQIRWDGVNNIIMDTKDYWTVVPGQAYELSMYLKTNVPDTTVRIWIGKMYGVAKQSTALAQYWFLPQTTWQKYTFLFRFPDASDSSYDALFTNFFLRIEFNSAYYCDAAVVNIDDIAIYKCFNASEPALNTNILHNASMDIGIRHAIAYGATWVDDGTGNMCAMLGTTAGTYCVIEPFAIGGLTGPTAYTFSCRLKHNSTGTKVAALRLYNRDTVGTPFVQTTFNVTSSWQTFSYTFATFTDTYNINDYLALWDNIFWLALGPATSGWNLFVDDIQFERGSSSSTFHAVKEVNCILSTTKHRNIFRTGEALAVTCRTVNYMDTAQSGTIVFKVYDHTGTQVYTDTHTFRSLEAVYQEDDFTIPATTIADGIYGAWNCVVTVYDSLSTELATDRIGITRIKDSDGWTYVDTDGFFGINSHYLTGSLTDDWEMVKDAKPTWIRHFFTVPADPTVLPTEADTTAAEAHTLGFKVLGTLTCASSLLAYTDDQIYAYVYALVNLNKTNVTAWETWNEPPGTAWGTAANFLSYNALANPPQLYHRRIAEAIKAADATATVVGNAFVNALFVDAFFDYIDVVSNHHYGVCNIRPESDVITVNDAFKAKIPAGHTSIPIWQTEGCYSANDEWENDRELDKIASQYIWMKCSAGHISPNEGIAAAWQIRKFIVEKTWGIAKSFYFATLNQDESSTSISPAETFHAWVRDFESSKAILPMFAQCARALDDTTPYYSEVENTEGVYFHLFKKSDGSGIAILWVKDEPAVDFKIRNQAKMVIKDCMGNTLSPSTYAIDYYVLNITRYPIYITFSGLALDTFILYWKYVMKQRISQRRKYPLY